MSDTELKFIGNLERLDLKDGDRFVLTCDHIMSLKQHERIRGIWSDFVGGNTESFPLLILDKGFKIGVLSEKAG